MASATVLIDTYRWYPSGKPGDGEIVEAEKGDTIDVSDKELARGVSLGALEPAGKKRGRKDATADEAEPSEPSEPAE